MVTRPGLRGLGASLLALAVAGPVAVAALSPIWFGDPPGTLDEGISRALTVSVTSAILAAFALPGTWLFGQSDDLRLRGFAVLRVLADAVMPLAVLTPSLQRWQISAALNVPEVLFVVAVLFALAEEANGDESLARSIRMFAAVYVAYRLGVLVASFASDLPLVPVLHRVTAPIMDGTIVILLLRTARKLKAS